jgi:predicted PhzF superfamily epimerase YddE/YHI9
VIDLVVVDAFTDTPFTGNPAAVTFLPAFSDDLWMQRVAGEMNLSETAFVVARPDGDHDLRWFTPAAEVDLCGHATLATAHLLGGSGRFHTRSGLLECRPGAAGLIEMDFPADPVVPAQLPIDLPGAEILAVARARTDLLIAVGDASWLRAYRPDIGAIAAIDGRALIITAPGDQPGLDFVSRVFAPRVGVPEDPVTGSAHCTLAGFWAGRTGQVEMTGYQASARGGTVGVRVDGDRVVLMGRAVTTSEVRMLVDRPV